MLVKGEQCIRLRSSFSVGAASASPLEVASHPCYKVILNRPGFIPILWRLKTKTPFTL